jgi:signal transduction histidine kinase
LAGGGDATVATALNSASSIVFTIALIGLTMLLFDKTRATGPVVRRAVAPVAAVFTATVGWFVISLYLVPAYPGTEAAVRVVDGVLGLAVPMAILVGLVAGDRLAAISLGQIAVRARDRALTPSAVQEVLADALGDPTVTLGVWDGVSGYVDIDGKPLVLPADPQARGVTRITRDNRPVAVLLHDPMLDTDSALLEGLAASSLMLLENGRLVAELDASRARIVKTAEQERRKLERDLHDGAQQRLVAALVYLSLADELADGNPQLRERVSEAIEEVEGALVELRELVHGIYPPALGRWGLGRAFDLLAARYPGVVVVSQNSAGRFRPEVEAAIYYCCLEAVQNASKHAGDAHVSIRLYTDEDGLHLEVRDDGPGFDVSQAQDGVGLQNMRDRLGAVGGHAEITSHPGQGTLVAATAPIGDRSIVATRG